MIFGFWQFLGVLFWGNSWVYEIFKNGFGMRMCDFGGGLFSEIYSFESSLYDFWILVVFGSPFVG